jgi:hypothetical protein
MGGLGVEIETPMRNLRLRMEEPPHRRNQNAKDRVCAHEDHIGNVPSPKRQARPAGIHPGRIEHSSNGCGLPPRRTPYPSNPNTLPDFTRLIAPLRVPASPIAREGSNLPSTFREPRAKLTEYDGTDDLVRKEKVIKDVKLGQIASSCCACCASSKWDGNRPKWHAGATWGLASFDAHCLSEGTHPTINVRIHGSTQLKFS